MTTERDLPRQPITEESATTGQASKLPLRKHSRAGKASIAIGLLLLPFYFLMMYLVFFMADTAEDARSHLVTYPIVGVLFACGVIVPVLGFTLGWAGFRRIDRHPAYSALGMIINGLIILFIVIPALWLLFGTGDFFKYGR